MADAKPEGSPPTASPATTFNPANPHPNGVPNGFTNDAKGPGGVNGLNGSAASSQTNAHAAPIAPSPVQGPAPPAAAATPSPAASQVYRQRSMPHGKVAIVEPPGSARRRTSPQGFGSPTRDYARDNPKFNDDSSRLTHAIQQSVPEAVRRTVRDNWEKALLGSEFHHAFIMNAVIHHADGIIIRRAIRDFGYKMVLESKVELISHFRPQDLDAVADKILEKASDEFLDKAMDKRLSTIDARSLINALARAERLGYEDNDTLDNPNHHPQPQVATPTQPVPSPFVHQPAAEVQHPVGQSPQIQNLQCQLCWRKFATAAPYEYHVKKQLCTKPPPNTSGFPFSCAYCGAGFITNVGQQYHLANKVCGDHGTAPATPKAPASGSPIPPSSRANSPALPSSSMPAPVSMRSSAYQTAATPSHYTASPYTAPPTATPGMPIPLGEADPYGHLTSVTRARMEDDLKQAELTYAPRFAEAETIPDLAQRKARLDALQNSFSTKQSIIRKKYGVRLRQRRTRAEIEAERERMARGGGSSNKRRRTDDYKSFASNPAYLNTSQQQQPASSTPEKPNPAVDYSPSKHLSVSDMNSAGLGGSSATAATTDPTAPVQSDIRPAADLPRNSLSSYQRSGYRISTHGRRSTQQSPASVSSDSTAGDQADQEGQARHDQANKEQRRGSVAAPMLLDDSNSDSDSDSDAEIPATLPSGRKASGTPLKALAG
ncbi:uncharacterized protein BCR38DRAFT_486602 [Pseudomassariella vexata]|uniref:Uncharacterized protein n=1 Tax=Pseudomassariella vexata TaxID=1141098 RepID=A0A1Y2DT47_9PEZI|nr:uncharacterized protein BCR38DRAFT_486602 [Pseudomassariella vexata]ORY62339.1 hypothetical protein BCR38DRAFT_486602 [Pseudomassariella vexata]